MFLCGCRFRNSRLGISAIFFLLALAALPAAGADFYIDPVHGSDDGDGSQQSPWRSLQDVVDSNLIESQGWESLPPMEVTKLFPRNAGAPIKGGDRILLADGYHGTLSITGYYNTDTITIGPVPGATPKFSSIMIRAGANWHLKGLSVSPEYAVDYSPGTMIDLDSHGWHGPVRDIGVEDCSLQSVADASNWSLSDWNTLPANGIAADGTSIIIRNNRLKNVNFGITVTASHSLIEHNVVENFAGDGLRGLGDYTTFSYNTVKNCYDVNDNHDDGFQSWSYTEQGVGTGEVVGIVLRGNTIINYEDPDQPFRGTLQGIGCFDGTFVDWVVENNVIYTDHYHGITLLGARNSRIVNNTVLDPNDVRPGPPWITIGAHKNGTKPVNCLIRNNLTTRLLQSEGVEYDSNILITGSEPFFINRGGLDFHLLPGSRAIDSGNSDLAPADDRDGEIRRQGAGIDIGAYEVRR